MKLLSVAAAVALFIVTLPLVVLMLVCVPRDEWAKLNDSIPPP